LPCRQYLHGGLLEFSSHCITNNNGVTCSTAPKNKENWRKLLSFLYHINTMEEQYLNLLALPKDVIGLIFNMLDVIDEIRCVGLELARKIRHLLILKFKNNFKMPSISSCY
jgi:hypothetical protein